MDRIAIVIPVFDNQGGLDRTLKSIQESQTDFTVLVVDDGSSVPIHVRGSDFSFKVHLLRLEKNSGIEVALNCGLDFLVERQFEFCARLDAGDLWVEGRLTKQLNYMKSNELCGVVGGGAVAIDRHGIELFFYSPPTKHQEISRKMHLSSCLLHTTWMLRLSAVRSCGYYSRSYRYAEDYELLFRIMSRYQLANLDDVCVKYEFDDIDGAISYGKRRAVLMARAKIQLKYFKFSLFESYWGVFRTVILFVVPMSLLHRVKGRLWGRS